PGGVNTEAGVDAVDGPGGLAFGGAAGVVLDDLLDPACAFHDGGIGRRARRDLLDGAVAAGNGGDVLDGEAVPVEGEAQQLAITWHMWLLSYCGVQVLLIAPASDCTPVRRPGSCAAQQRPDIIVIDL